MLKFQFIVIFYYSYYIYKNDTLSRHRLFVLYKIYIVNNWLKCIRLIGITVNCLYRIYRSLIAKCSTLFSLGLNNSKLVAVTNLSAACCSH